MANHILTVLTNTGSKNVRINASSVDEALKAYTPAKDETVIGCELERQKVQRDAVTTEKAHRDARLWRRNNG